MTIDRTSHRWSHWLLVCLICITNLLALTHRVTIDRTKQSNNAGDIDPVKWPHPSHIESTETRDAAGGSSIDTGGRTAVRDHHEVINNIAEIALKSPSPVHREARQDLDYNIINTVGGQTANDHRRTSITSTITPKLTYPTHQAVH